MIWLPQRSCAGQDMSCEWRNTGCQESWSPLGSAIPGQEAARSSHMAVDYTRRCTAKTYTTGAEIVTLCSFSVTIFLLCHFSVTFTVIFVSLLISFVLECHFFVTFYLKKILGVTSQSPTDSLSCSSLFCHFVCHFFVILCVTFSSLWIYISITRTYRTLP